MLCTSLSASFFFPQHLLQLCLSCFHYFHNISDFFIVLKFLLVTSLVISGVTIVIVWECHDHKIASLKNVTVTQVNCSFPPLHRPPCSLRTTILKLGKLITLKLRIYYSIFKMYVQGRSGATLFSKTPSQQPLSRLLILHLEDI